MTNFLSVGRNLVQGTTREARRDNWDVFQTNVRKRLDVLDGEWLLHLKEWSQERFSAIGWNEIYRDKWPWSTSVNMMRRVINRIARVYTGPVRRRRYKVDKETREAIVDPGYDALLESLTIDLNRIGKSALDYGLAGSICLARPFLRDDLKSWAVHLLTPDLFWPDVDPIDPSRLLGLTYIVPLPDSPLSQTLYEQWVYSIDPNVGPYIEHYDQFGTLKKRIGDNRGPNGGPATDGAYPYYVDKRPILPFALCRPYHGPMELCNRSVGLSEYQLTLTAALVETIKSWSLIQGGKFMVVSGSGEIAKQLGSKPFDISTPLMLSAADVTVAMLDRVDDVARFDTAIEIWEQRCVEEKTGTRTDDTKSGVESAKALQIRDKGLAGAIADLQLYSREFEEGLSTIMSLEWNLYSKTGPKVDIEGTRFSVDFPDWLAADPIEAIAEYKEMIDMGVINTAQYLMKLNPDVQSEDEAIEIIQHNKIVERQITGISPQAALAAATLPGPNNEPAVMPEPDERMQRELDKRAGPQARDGSQAEGEGEAAGARPGSA